MIDSQEYTYITLN